MAPLLAPKMRLHPDDAASCYALHGWHIATRPESFCQQKAIRHDSEMASG